MRLETNPVTQLQTQGANSKNRKIRIIVIKIVFHHGEHVNISQSEAIEPSGVSIGPIILFMCLVKWVTLVLVSGIYVQHWVWIMAHVSPWAAVKIFKANLFCKTSFLICACLALRAEIAFWESCNACWVKLVKATTHSITSVVPKEGTTLAACFLHLETPDLPACCPLTSASESSSVASSHYGSLSFIGRFSWAWPISR